MMTDVLQILQQLGDKQSSGFYFALIAIFVCSIFYGWKHFWSTGAILERKKLKLEIFKLGLEIAELEKRLSPSEQAAVPQEYAVKDVLETVKRAERHSLRSIREPFFRRQKWLKFFAVGGFSASVAPIVFICNGILHLPQGTNADTLRFVCAVWIGFWFSISLIAGIVAVKLSELGTFFTAFVGLALGFVLFPLVGPIFTLFLQINAVFLNAGLHL